MAVSEGRRNRVLSAAWSLRPVFLCHTATNIRRNHGHQSKRKSGRPEWPNSLGKESAGRQVLVEKREPGVWLIRTAKVIPENELWLHQPKASEDLRRALTWAQENPRRESAPDAIFEKLTDERKPKRKARQARSK